MKTFRRLSAAVAFAGDRPYVRVQIGQDRIYIVADEGEELATCDGVELVSAPSARTGSREITGHVSFGHLDRLGNANGAAASRGEYTRRKTFHVDQRRGLAHRFQDQAETDVEALDRIGFLAMAREATWSTPDAFERDSRSRKEATEFAADRAAGLAATEARQPRRRQPDYSDVDPRDLDPETGAPVAGYSSPSLDDSFHRGEMEI